MKDLCTKCKNREKCVKLCKQALNYINQDYASLKEVYTKTGEEWELDRHAHDAVINGLTMQEWYGGIPELGLWEWHIIKNIDFTKLQRQCMWLHYWDGLTQEQIAEKFGISQQTVQEHIEAAKKKINKDELQEKLTIIQKLKQAGLTDRQLQIAMLYFEFDMTQAQIASKLGISQKNVSKNLKFVKNKLK